MADRIDDLQLRDLLRQQTQAPVGEPLGRWPQMRELGLTRFRVDLLRESPARATKLLDRYARVVAGLDDGRTAWRELSALNQLGVTRGTLQLL